MIQAMQPLFQNINDLMAFVRATTNLLILIEKNGCYQEIL